MKNERLLEAATSVLRKNEIGGWTQPAPGMYPHQWLWDSCFIAIGLRHIDIDRAQSELRSLTKGQWKNGMMPHIIFSKAAGYHAGPWLWQTERIQNAPSNIATSGITQPPMLAEAVTRVGAKMKHAQRQVFFREMYAALIAYHEWLYRDRCPNEDGLIVLVHSWECGLDNTPPWIIEVDTDTSLAIRALEKIPYIEQMLTHVRQDTHHVAADERLSAVDLYHLYSQQRKLKNWKYDSDIIIDKANILVVDLAFNSILARANSQLSVIAEEIGDIIPPKLADNIAKTAKNLDSLWYNDQFYSRDYLSGEPILEPSIATFLPLYSGCIDKDRAEQLVDLSDKPEFSPKWPVPSVPTDSDFFDPRRYWQGPVWVNINWLIADGMAREGYLEKANKLRKQTLDLVSKNGMYEYYSPIDGKGAGVKDFSWTAALTIDLLRA